MSVPLWRIEAAKRGISEQEMLQILAPIRTKGESAWVTGAVNPYEAGTVQYEAFELGRRDARQRES